MLPVRPVVLVFQLLLYPEFLLVGILDCLIIQRAIFFFDALFQVEKPSGKNHVSVRSQNEGDGLLHHGLQKLSFSFVLFIEQLSLSVETVQQLDLLLQSIGRGLSD